MPPVEREPGEDDDLDRAAYESHIVESETDRPGPSPSRAAPDGLPPDLADDIRVLPLYSALEGLPTQAVFVAGAVLYYRLREIKGSLGNLFRHHAVRPAPGVPMDHYQHVVGYFLSTDHPEKWVMCRRCDGAGCQSCLRRGYSIQGVR